MGILRVMYVQDMVWLLGYVGCEVLKRSDRVAFWLHVFMVVVVVALVL